jgi:outer membrane protein assembly factor BamB
MALDARDGSNIWETDVDFAGYPQYSGFYGGITVHESCVYAASYVFYGTGNNSGLFKFDAADGQIVWVAPCERTESIPVVTDDGRVYLAAGLDGFGSAVKVQTFQDNGETVTPLWDTYVDTGGSLVIGGWTHQPAWARGYLYTGSPPDESASFLPYTDLYILDTSRVPGDADFVVEHYAGTGGSPALADGTLYSLGQDGLFAFHPSPACLADLDGDGVVGLSDLAALLGAYGSASGGIGFDSDADLNRDGVVDLADLAELLGSYGEECP